MLAAPTDVRAARAGRLRGLYAITPDVADTRALSAMVAAAIDGGAAAVQYRNKSANADERRAQAYALALLFIVNDDASLAALVNADGVHLGEDDGDLAAARGTVGPDALIGASSYGDIARARVLADAGADYIAFGSLFPSAVKPGARRASLDVVRAALALGVPIVGIGGIDAENAGQVIEAGADAVAVISAVFGDDDIESAARAIAQACEAAWSER
jgi:thiamine-phosphate pyrophosphorylase